MRSTCPASVTPAPRAVARPRSAAGSVPGAVSGAGSGAGPSRTAAASAVAGTSDVDTGLPAAGGGGTGRDRRRLGRAGVLGRDVAEGAGHQAGVGGEGARGPPA